MSKRRTAATRAARTRVPALGKPRHKAVKESLLGEIAALTLVAFPLGCAVGYLLALVWHSAFVTELFRVPFAILPATYGVSILITVAATVLAALLVRRRLDHLDLIAVLKTRE